MHFFTFFFFLILEKIFPYLYNIFVKDLRKWLFDILKTLRGVDSTYDKKHNIPLEKFLERGKYKMKKGKRILALLLAITIFNPIFPNMISSINAATSYAYTAETDLGDFSAGATLSQGTYYLNDDMTFNGSESGNGLKIAEEATVVIYLNGHTLTATGKNAVNSEKRICRYIITRDFHTNIYW